MKKITVIIASLFLIIALSGCSVVDKVQVKMDGEKYGSADAFVQFFDADKSLKTATEKFFNQLDVKKGDIEIRNATINTLKFSDGVSGKVKFVNCIFPYDMLLDYIGGQIEFDNCTFPMLMTAVDTPGYDIVLKECMVEKVYIKSIANVKMDNCTTEYFRTKGKSTGGPNGSNILINGDIKRVDIASGITGEFNGNFDTFAVYSDNEAVLTINGTVKHFATEYFIQTKGNFTVEEITKVEGVDLGFTAPKINDLKFAVQMEKSMEDGQLGINKKMTKEDMGIIWEGYTAFKVNSLINYSHYVLICPENPNLHIWADVDGFSRLSIGYYDKKIGGY
ncbi:MAG: hypothetical protein RRX95_02975, partial [Oscillospiraceae bacterium]